MQYRSEHFPERNLGTLADFLNLELPFPVIHQGDTVQLKPARCSQPKSGSWLTGSPDSNCCPPKISAASAHQYILSGTLPPSRLN